MTGLYYLTPDSYNYLNVSENISMGNGFAQSTIGFNQPLIFKGNSNIPSSQISQPPLYPLLISFVDLIFNSRLKSAVFVSTLFFILTLLLIYLNLKQNLGFDGALLVILTLYWFVPIRIISRTVWSESPGIFFILLFIFLLASSGKNIGEYQRRMVYLVLGFIGGLATLSRYALAPIIIFGSIYLFMQKDIFKVKTEKVFFLISGFIIIVSCWFLRNYLVSGVPFSVLLESETGIIKNSFYSIKDVTGNIFFYGKFEVFQRVLLLGLFCLSTYFVIKSGRRNIKLVFNTETSLLLTWGGFYWLIFVVERSVFHFDLPDMRLLSPATTTIFLAFLIVGINQIYQKGFFVRYSQFLIITLICVTMFNEIRINLNTSNQNKQTQYELTERVGWCREFLTKNDLVIGEDVVDLTYYSNCRNLISYSEYPYNIPLTYTALSEFISKNKSYSRILLVLKKNNNSIEDNIRYYGEFIGGFYRNRQQKKDKFQLITELKDAFIYKYDM